MASKRTTNQAIALANETVLPIFLVFTALFTAVACLLGVQVAQGKDPVLGEAKIVRPQRKVLVRKVVVVKKVTMIVNAPTAAGATGPGAVAAGTAGSSYVSGGGGGGGGSYSAPSQSYSAPSQTYSAPVQSAPAPVQSAPAPVQTATS
ncbi:MAG: hypothetical protein WCK97_05585 [Actinomycetes bacterium]